MNIINKSFKAIYIKPIINQLSLYLKYGYIKNQVILNNNLKKALFSSNNQSKNNEEKNEKNDKSEEKKERSEMKKEKKEKKENKASGRKLKSNSKPKQKRILSIRPSDLPNEVNAFKAEEIKKKHLVYMPLLSNIIKYERRVKKRGNYKLKLNFYIGDKVRVIKGEHKDKEGKIVSISKDHQRVKVEGVNLKEKLQDPFSLYQKYKMNIESYPKKYYPDYIDIKEIMIISPYVNKTCLPIFLDNKNPTRICPFTKKKIMIQKKKSPTRVMRNVKKRETNFDTDEKNVRIITYKGMDYSGVARVFLDMMKEKKDVESKLIMKDKIYKNI